MPCLLIDPATMAPAHTVRGYRAMMARRLWFAAKCGAAVAAFNAPRQAAVTAFLTCDGAFCSLASARDHVSGFGGDARLVFALRADGLILKTRRR